MGPSHHNTQELSPNDDVNNDGGKKSKRFSLPPAVSLPILVFIDMFAVAQVVPLLFQYYRKAGVVSATQRELLSSIFSASQIIGGLLLGALTDAKFLKKTNVLYLSFGGSAVAYLMITFGGFRALIMSRILVGLVKQTMTITTSMLANSTTPENRAKDMGRLESSSTAAWILGPSTGALLFKYVDHKAPALLASSLFVLNMILAGLFLNEDLIEENSSDTSVEAENTSDRKTLETNSNGKDFNNQTKDKKTKRSFYENAKSCFKSKSLASVVACLLIFSWMYRATSYASMGSYYEEMYGVEPHARGYIQSYQRVWAFIVQSMLIQPVLKRAGGERKAVFWAAILLAGSTFLESKQHLGAFLVAICPSIALSTTMMGVSLRSLLTQMAPGDAIFSVFAAMDVLQNATAVTVPFYRAFLFRFLSKMQIQHDGESAGVMEGDPDPVVWVMCAGLHWVIASIAMLYLLRPEQGSSSNNNDQQGEGIKAKTL